ncbi:MAG TPA: TetR/AcrR family transcriptional regulator [Sphingomonas sp.]|nr:TetR/AcrR family transcriptional regulator [Sphingomonas sp.]
MDVKPRKSPRQARAKATADAIIDASTQLLLDQGYDRFTTARVAERAGVSVGSLYQYFPNKAALAAAVIDRCCDAFVADLERALAGRPRITLAECIRAIVDVILISHHLTPDLHRIVIELAPRIGVAEKTERMNRRMAEGIEAVLRMHIDEIAPAIDLATAATIIETLLVALAHRAGTTDPAPDRTDAIARETTAMITRYLAAR